MSAKTAQKKEAEKVDEEIIERTAPRGNVIYEAIYREGGHELERENLPLAWSGLAAGLSMGFSFLAEGLLRDYLPPGKWQPLLAKFGYSVGFLVVILGRQQLFTKNTLTVILPLLKMKKIGLLKNVARLWLIVLLTNMIGARFLRAWWDIQMFAVTACATNFPSLAARNCKIVLAQCYCAAFSRAGLLP